MILSARTDSLSGVVDEFHPFQRRVGILFASKALVAREKLFLIM